MKDSEKGFLLLTAHLGDPERPVLTVAQFRELTKRIRQAPRQDGRREMTEQDLVDVGYDRNMARRILGLLEQKDVLEWYLHRGKNCVALTRGNENYPLLLRKRLGLDAPGCLWAKGDLTLLNKPAVALVGSRELRPENKVFAQTVGREVARQGYVLVSGNAAGADRTAQTACLEAGGQVISVVADRLDEKPELPNVLWLSEEGYDLPFSAWRALSRNRVIHSLGTWTFVAQCDTEKGGTWDGTTKNLRNLWSPVFCFSDGSSVMAELVCRGASAIGLEALMDIGSLQPDMMNFIDQ